MKKYFVLALLITAVASLPSCYKNRYDISEDTLNSLEKVSFRNDVVPIIVSGACGCHNNGTTRQVPFMHGDTVFYSTILARSGMLNDMANGGAHPGEGNVYFTPSQAKIIKTWFAQGAQDDYVAPPVTGEVGYTSHIVPIYRTACKGSSCHGGVAIPLDYTSMKNSSSALSAMMASGGSSGHPGGALSLDGTTRSTFLAWIQQGFKP